MATPPKTSDPVLALRLSSREHVALVGAGGKTSLLLSLAKECRRGGMRVLATTTTKMWHREAQECGRILFTETTPHCRERLQEELAEHGRAFLARRLLDTGKVEGIPPSLADELYRAGASDLLVAEADGAAGRPVKAPASFEPVIARSVTKVIVLMGADALGKPLGPDVVFRDGLFASLAGCQAGDRLSPSLLAAVLLHPSGPFRGSPPSAEKIVFLNRVDLLENEEVIRELAGLVLEAPSGGICRVVLGSLAAGHFLSMGRDHE